MSLQNINAIPVRTWRWLRVNDTSLSSPIPAIVPYQTAPLNLPTGFRVLEEKFSPITLEKEVEYSQFIAQNCNHTLSLEITPQAQPEQPLVLEYELSDTQPTLVEQSVITVRSGADANLIISLRGTGNNLFHAALLKIVLEKDARLTLTKLQSMDSGINLDFTVVEQDSSSRFEFVQTELGANQTITSCVSTLKQPDAVAKYRTLYIGTQEQKLDFNQSVQMQGKNSVGDILTSGVLFDKAHKVYRGTIDFQKGSHGSKASESESVLLLSNQARNVTVPLLLCVEDDVEGAHAGSTGNFDESAIFYLMTRGLSKEQAQKMLIQAQFLPIVEEIPHQATRQQVWEQVEGRLQSYGV